MKVTLNGLTKEYGETTAVSGLSITLADGQLTALLGPSGCGKSTTLYMLAGITPVTRGQILFDGQDVTNEKPEGRGIGLVFQNYALYPHMTVLENICFPLEIQRVKKAERVERARSIARQVRIDKLLSRRPAELSGGQQQRVAIARALVKKPRLLLLDEPLSNLDARLRIEMREEIRRIQQETGVTAVFVTHDQEEAMSISDRIVLMRDGVLMQQDAPQALYDEPANCFVADFLGNPPINRLPGRIQGGRFVADEGGEGIPLPRPAGLADGTEADLSIRAESFVLGGGEASFRVPLLRSYVMGKEKLAVFRIGGREVRAYIDDLAGCKAGERVPLGLKESGVFLFDRTSGERLL